MTERPALPPTTLHVLHCPEAGCTYAALGRRDSATLAAVGAHLSIVHQSPVAASVLPALEARA